jgi:nucleoside-diphosphate-sugar epimerase
MRLFVHGANGRTGTEIIELARKRGHEVTGFVRSPEKLTPAGRLTVVCGDPRSPETMARLHSLATMRCCRRSARIRRRHFGPIRLGARDGDGSETY